MGIGRSCIMAGSWMGGGGCGRVRARGGGQIGTITWLPGIRILASKKKWRISPFEDCVRDGIESQQMTELKSMLNMVSLSNSRDRWRFDLTGDGEFRVKEGLLSMSLRTMDEARMPRGTRDNESDVEEVSGPYAPWGVEEREVETEKEIARETSILNFCEPKSAQKQTQRWKDKCRCHRNGPVQTRLNYVPRNDDGGHVGEKSKVNAFSHPCQPFGEATEKLLVGSEYIVAERYVLLNCAEITPFVKEFDDLMTAANLSIRDEELDHLRDLEFSKWVKGRVSVLSKVAYHNQIDSTRKTGEHQATINSGVCVRGSCYNDYGKDYYGILLDVIQLHYVGGYRVTLFKCHWFDNERGIKVDGKHGLVDINIKSKLGGNDPFVLAEQAQQVYYTTYPARKRSRIEWLGVCKTTARSTYNSDQNIIQGDEVTLTVDGFYQEDEMPPPSVVGVDVDLDQVVNLPLTEVEEVEEVHVPTMHTINTSDEDVDDDEEEFDDEDSAEEEDDIDLSSSDNE
ncbi:transposon, En/Spm-like protein [Tanacetum coccineum]